MDNFSTTIKNQLSFNKMLESQLQQLANIVPANQGKILGQPEELETTNLVDIFNAESYWSDPISKGWNDETLPWKYASISIHRHPPIYSASTLEV
jgi:hypothetical protein